MSIRSQQVAPSSWLAEPGLTRHVERLEPCLDPGVVPGTAVTHRDLELAVGRGRRLHARAVRGAFAAAVRAPADLGRALYAAWRRRADERRAVRELEALDDRLLADIGLARAEIPLAVRGLVRARRGAENVTPLRRRPCAAPGDESCEEIAA